MLSDIVGHPMPDINLILPLFRLLDTHVQDFASHNVCLPSLPGRRVFGVARVRSYDRAHPLVSLLPPQPAWSGLC